FVAMRCGNAVMTDPFGDVAAALNERDIVGDPGHPAGLRASDATNLYMRIRLEDDPAPSMIPLASSWGMEFDFDNSRTTYEILVLVDGRAAGGPIVSVFNNTTTTLPNDPNDPADLPPTATFQFATNARSGPAPGTNFGG